MIPPMAPMAAKPTDLEKLRVFDNINACTLRMVTAPNNDRNAHLR